MERVTEIESVPRPWQGRVLPLNHTRMYTIFNELGRKLQPRSLYGAAGQNRTDNASLFQTWTISSSF